MKYKTFEELPLVHTGCDSYASWDPAFKDLSPVLEMPAVTFSIPTVDVQQVVSTAINFTAEGYTPSATGDANVFALDVPFGQNHLS